MQDVGRERWTANDAVYHKHNFCRVRSYQPPSDDLIAALTVLARYIVAADDARDGSPKPALATAWLPDIASEASTSSLVSLLCLLMCGILGFQTMKFVT